MKNIILARLLISGLLLLSITNISNAETTESLEPLVVSATRWETQGIPTANNITVITRKQIIESGANRIVDVLRGQGGIQIRDLFGDGSRATIDMRGFGSAGGANTLILVDGRRLNNTDGHDPDLHFISLKDVERIEIVQGSASVLYGDKAVGGVINIITRKTTKFDADIELGYGSYDHQSQVLKLANRFDNGASVRVSAERRRSDNYRDNNKLEYWNSYTHLAYEWDAGRVFAEAQRTLENIRLPGALFIDEINISRKQTVNPLDFNKTASSVGRIGGILSFTPVWDFATEFTIRDEDVIGHLTVGGFSSGILQKRLLKSFNPRVRGRIPISDQDLMLIIGGDIDDTDYFLNSDAIGFQRSNQAVQSAYSLATLPVNDVIAFTGGLRKAWLQHDIHDGFVFGGFRFPPGTELKDNQTASTIGITVTPNNAWRFFMKRETSYRFPLVDEETNVFVPVTLRGPLETQTGTSYEAGAEWQNYWLLGKFTGYNLDLENEIGFDITSENINLDPTKRTGIIFELRMSPVHNLSLDTQYSFIHAGFDSGINADKRIPLVAKHQLHLGITYQFLTHWSLYGETFFISDRIAGGDFTNANAKLPGHGIANLNLRFDYDQFSIEARVDNILDKEYRNDAAVAFNPFPLRETAYFTAPERNLFLTFIYEFN